jgi:hypothetical protein
VGGVCAISSLLSLIGKSLGWDWAGGGGGGGGGVWLGSSDGKLFFPHLSLYFFFFPLSLSFPRFSLSPTRKID